MSISMKFLLSLACLWTGLVATASAPTPPGPFSECAVVNYKEVGAMATADKLRLTAASPAANATISATDAVKTQTWIVRSASATNVTYAVKQTLLGNGEVELCSYTPNRVLATLEKEKSEAAFRVALAAKGLTVKYELMKDSDGNSVFVVESSDTENDVVETMTASIQSTGFCGEKIYRNTVYSVCSSPNDTAWSEQWNMEKIVAPEAWDATTDASGVTVAVLDTGLNYNNYDLNENLWTNPGEVNRGSNGADDDGNGIVDDIYGMSCIGGNVNGNPMDDKGHGSHCAGIIGAVGNNNLGIAGIAWSAKIMALKFCDSSGNGSLEDMIRCLNYAEDKGARVINCSWVTKGQWDDLLGERIKSLGRKGVIFVCAAGNANKGESPVDLDEEGPPTYPACFTFSNIVTVAATDQDDELASFSFWGARAVDIAAPGVEIYSTVLGSMGFANDSGTSMAAPHVTGALALLMAYYPEQNSYELVQKLYDCGEPLDSLKGKVKTGKRLSLKGLFGLRAPTGADVTASLGTSSEAVILYWNAVTGATFYRVWRAETADGEKTLLRDWHAGLTFSDTTAEPGKPYYYFLQAAGSATGASASPYSTGVIGYRAASATSVTVTFDAAGGTVSTASADFEMGGTYGDLPVPTYAGNVFLGWHTAATGGTRVNADSVVRAEISTLHAHWIADGEPRLENLFARQRYPWNGYVDVSFLLAGLSENYAADVSLAARPGNGGAAIPLKTWVGAGPTNLVSGSHAFVWNSGVDAPGGLFTNLTLAATLAVKARGVTISFNGNGGTPSEGSRKYTPNVAYGSLPTATRAGYTFAGWYTASSGGTPVTTSSTVPSAATTLYAHWTVITPPAPTNVSATDGTYSDKVVVAWSAVSGASTYYIYRNTSNSSGGAVQIGTSTTTSYTDTTATAGTTYWYWVKAHRSDNGQSSAFSSSDSGYRKKIPVSLVISGADSVRAGGSYTYAATVAYNNNTTATVTPTWSLSEGSSYGSVTAAGVFTANGTATQRTVKIAACYAENGVTVTAALKTVTITTFSVTITFDGNGGTASASSQSYMAYGTYGSLPTATQSGYTFAGWYTASSGGTPVTTSSTVPSAATTLYAHWTALVPGKPTVTATDGTYSDKVVVSWTAATNALTYRVYRDDYHDLKRLRTLCTTNSTSYSDTSATPGVTYNYFVRGYRSDNGQYGSLSDPDSGYRKKIPVSLVISGADSVRAGGSCTYTATVTYNDDTTATVTSTWSISEGSSYGSITAAGVFTANGTATQRTVKIAASYAENGVTVTAALKTVTITTFSVTITFDGNGGTASASSQSYTAYGTYGSLPTATRSGYTFAGWYTASSGGTQVTMSSTVPSSATTLYAHWTAITPPAPTGVSATDGTYSDKVVVSWSAVSGASTYYIYRNTSNSSGGATQIGETASTSYSDTSATPGTTYYYWVRAYRSDNGQYSAFSESDSGCKKIPVSLEIEGASSVRAGKSATYTATVTYNDNSTATVTPEWSLSEGASYGSITDAGVFTAKVTATQRTAEIDASHAENGVTVTAAPKTVTITTFTVTVTFDGNGGTSSVASKAYTAYGTYGTIPTATRSGYNFGGWWTASSGGTQVTTSTVVLPLPTTLYAHWTAITPSVPTNVSATDGTYSDKVVVSWTAAANALSYIVYRNTSNSSGGATQLGSTASTSYTDTTATVGMTYYYWVKAYRSDNGLSSAFSASDSGYRKKIPVSLVISGADSVRAGGSCTYTATVTYNDDTTATVTPTWSLSEGSSYGSVTAAGVFTANGTATQRTVKIAACYAENGVTVTAALKTVTITTFSVTITFDGNGGTASASSQSYTAYGKYGTLPTATRAGYTFAGWYTASSGGTQVTTSSVVLGIAATLYAHWTEITPSVPTNVSATDGTYSDKVVVSWTAAANALSYIVYRNTSNSSGGATQLGSTASTSYTDTTATVGMTYYYWVKAYRSDNGLSSAFSASDSGYRTLSAPTGVTASSGDSTSGTTIAWNGVDGATSYSVYRNTSSDSSSAAVIGTVSATGYTDTTGTPGKNYYYWIVANCNLCQSAFSGASVGYRKMSAPTVYYTDNLESGYHVHATWPSGAVQSLIYGANAYSGWAYVQLSTTGYYLVSVNTPSSFYAVAVGENGSRSAHSSTLTVNK